MPTGQLNLALGIFIDKCCRLRTLSIMTWSSYFTEKTILILRAHTIHLTTRRCYLLREKCSNIVSVFGLNTRKYGGSHSISTYPKFSKKKKFITPCRDRNNDRWSVKIGDNIKKPVSKISIIEKNDRNDHIMKEKYLLRQA